MARSGTLTVRVIGDTKDFKSKLDGATSKVGQFAKAAVAAGAAAAVAFGVKAVKAGMELNETLSKTEQVFKGAAGDVIDFADEMASAFGLPKQEILDAASNIGLVAKASGLSEEAAAGMSTEMAQLAADASSFFNVPLEQALEKIRAGLVGEAEPLRSFGVLLSAAAVEEKAVAAGIAEAGEELSEQQKVMARSMIITEQMADASGDLERTQDSLANRFRALKGRAENFAAEVGMRLIPFVSRAFDAFEAFGRVAGPAVEGMLGRLSSVLSPVTSRIQELTEGEYGLIDAFKTGVKHHGEVFEDMNTLEALLSKVGGVFADYRDTVEDVFADVADAVGRFISTFRTWVGQNEQTISAWQSRIAQIVGKIAPLFRAAFDAVKTVVGAALTIITAFWDRFGRHLIDFAARTFGRILAIVSEAFDVLTGLFDIIAGVLTGDWSRAWEGIKEVVGSAWEIIENIVTGAWDILKTAFGAGVAVISQLWSGLWAGIKGTVFAVVNSVIRAVEGMVNDIIDGVNIAIRAFNKISPRDISEAARVVFGRVGSGTAATPDPRSAGGGGGGLVAHTGGQFRTTALSGEGFVKVKDREWLVPDEKMPSGGTVNHFHFPNYIGTPEDIKRLVKEALADNKRRNGSALAGI